MTKLRNTLIGAAALSLSLVAVASPAGASTPHPKFINTIHRVAPFSKHRTTKYLVNFGETTCHVLGKYPTYPGNPNGDMGPVAEVLGIVQDNNSEYSDGFSDTQISDLVGVSILYLCPSYELGVQQFNQNEGSGATDPGGGSEWVWEPASSASPTPAPAAAATPPAQPVTQPYSCVYVDGVSNTSGCEMTPDPTNMPSNFTGTITYEPNTGTPVGGTPCVTIPNTNSCEPGTDTMPNG